MSDPFLRLLCFLVILGMMLAWEWLAPLRDATLPRRVRWTANFGLSAINSVLVQLVVRSATPLAALGAEWYGIGLFNSINAPVWVAMIGSFVLLDLVIYFQHRLFHYHPLLWRLHRMHHADTHLDTTSGLRFHPLEAVVSLLIKGVAVVALGAPALAVLIFEIVLNGSSLFNHGNVQLPSKLDRILRWVVVTPDMHRVHHSLDGTEVNRNFGFNLPWWDRLFGTYKAQPDAGHMNMTIGLDRYRAENEQGLGPLLVQPFGRNGNS